MSPAVQIASQSAVDRNALWTCLLRTRVLIEQARAITATASSLRRYKRSTDEDLTAALRRSRWRITTRRPLPRVVRRKDV